MAAYLFWIAAVVGYTVTVSLKQVFNPTDPSGLRGNPKIWYLNLWTRGTKHLWFVVTFLLAVICCLSLFIQDLMR
jgi:hypothetical protein